MITPRRTPKRTGRKRRKGHHNSSSSNMEKLLEKL